jgi:hypothetical protein
MVDDLQLEDSVNVQFKWAHLSLCVLEVFFENDTETLASVKPLIHRYADFAGLATEHQQVEELRSDGKFHEQTLSQLLKSIVEMNAPKREEIFNQKNLSSLTVLIELLIKSKLEVLDDVKAILGNKEKIDNIQKKLRQKGYVDKFIVATMEELFGRESEATMKRKEKQPAGVNSPIRGVPQEIIHTTTRRIQLFPAIHGAFVPGILLFAFTTVSIIFAVLGVGYINSFDGSVAFQCMQAVAQGQIPLEYQTICQANSSATLIGLFFLVVSLLTVIAAVICGVKFFKIVLHNQFANTHNTFELTHYTMSNK